MINVKFKLRKLTPDQKSMGKVYLVCFFNAEDFYFYTGKGCTRAQWDGIKMEFKKNFDTYQSANMLLSTLKFKAESYENDCLTNQKKMDKDELKAILKGVDTKSKSKKSIETLSKEFLAFKESEGLKGSSMRTHRATHDHFRKFCSSRKLVIDGYTNDEHTRFVAYLKRKRDYHPNYLGIIAKNLKVFFRWVEGQGIKLAENHAKMKQTFVEPKKQVLSKEEVMLIANLTEQKFEDWKKIKMEGEGFEQIPFWNGAERSRDVFFFQCMTGLRHSDLIRMTKDNIVMIETGPALMFSPQKSTSYRNKVKTVFVSIIPAAQKIIEKYEGKCVGLLPVPALRWYNFYIHYIAEAAGLTYNVEQIEYVNNVPVSRMVPKFETITSHTARHTFGTLSRVFGMDLADLKDVMGHSDQKTTLIYDHMAASLKADKQNKVWGGFGE